MDLIFEKNHLILTAIDPQVIDDYMIITLYGRELDFTLSITKLLAMKNIIFFNRMCH